jgi:hypothetical protein
MQPITTLRETSEEISQVEQMLHDLGETGHLPTDDLIARAKARLGHANGRLVAIIVQADMSAAAKSANLPIPQKDAFGSFLN